MTSAQLYDIGEKSRKRRKTATAVKKKDKSLFVLKGLSLGVVISLAVEDVSAAGSDWRNSSIIDAEGRVVLVYDRRAQHLFPSNYLDSFTDEDQTVDPEKSALQNSTEK